jgi:hypothetical protein
MESGVPSTQCKTRISGVVRPVPTWRACRGGMLTCLRAAFPLSWGRLITAVVVLVLVSRHVVAQDALSLQRDTLEGMPRNQSGITPAQVSEILKSRQQQNAAVPVREPFAGPNEPNVPPADQAEASVVELLLSGRTPQEVSTDLSQFGYDVFRGTVSTFAPVMNVPVGPDYVIGPGDGFTLTMWGRVDAQFSLQVDRNGQIVLRVGELSPT